MSHPNTDLWRDMMKYLRAQHAPICRQWFEQLEPGNLSGGLLTIHTHSQVQTSYLQNRCIHQFTEAVQSATGKLVTVQFADHALQENTVSALEQPRRGQRPQRPVAGRSSVKTLPGNGGGAGGAGGAGGFEVHAAPEHVLASLPKAGSVSGSVPRHISRSSSSSPASADNQAWSNDQILISPDYSFDRFVTGPENDLAYSASVAVANQPGTAYNPLFIHGGVGLGKTHLLQAICQHLLEINPHRQICYLSCDAFINQFLDCVQRGKVNAFRHRYRHVDLLVIDDIHFLANRERTQEEFFHTFNELHQLKKQIVLSSDLPPGQIPDLEDRLISRFQSGLVAMIDKPHYETRLAIVRAKAELRQLEMPDDVICHIAHAIASNTRELEGAITTLQGHAHLHDKPIDLALAQQVLGKVPQSGNGKITLQQVIDVVTAYYNVRLSDLQSKRRHQSITGPRQICMWLARKHTRFSLEEIGGYFGGRDHTTVMHAQRIVDLRIEQDPDYANDIKKIAAQIV